MDSERFLGLAVALGLGLLVGMQREWKDSGTAGVRTFAIFALLGAVLAQLGDGVAPWAVAAGLIAVMGLLILGNAARISHHDSDIGLTTEAAALLIYGIGAAAGQGHIAPAVVVGGATAVLLHWKQPIHQFIDSIGEKDFRGVAQLVLIGLVILPLLPDETYGPYDVLNPYRIWWMVVLIVGISLCAYVVQRLIGDRMGALLGGLLGGMISSTATTVSYAKQAANQSSSAALTAVVIMLASTIVNARAMFEVGVVAPGLLRYVLLPFGIIAAAMLLLTAIAYRWSRGEKLERTAHENPAQLRAAIFFGLLYAAVLFIVAAVRTHFGDRALYGVAVISGLTDMDAITLSAAKMFRDDRIGAGMAWRMIMIGMMANLVFKAGAVSMLGSRRLTGIIFILFGATLAIGAALLAFWPDYAISLPQPPSEGELR